MTKRLIMTACGTALLIAAAVVVALCERQSASLPEAPVAQTSAKVRVKAVERKVEAVEQGEIATASDAIAIICGADEATADRYEARNDALRSIARRRNLSKNDVAALMAYLSGTNDVLRVERVAALKNDVMNLLRAQEPPPADLATTLIGMFKSAAHPPVVLDYCIQHLGAMLVDIKDETMRSKVRGVFISAAREKRRPYAGTALYSLAEDRLAMQAQKAELRRLTVALCRPDANSASRIAAIQLAGERGYSEVLTVLRETLSASRRDAVLDIVCIGSLGLLGTEKDLPLISKFADMGRRYAVAVEAATRRIKER